MLTTYLSGLVGETITKLVNLHGEVAGLENPDFNVLGVQTAGGSNIVPTFYEEENDYLSLLLNEDGSLSTNGGDFVNVAAITNKLTAANCTFKLCGEDVETSVVSALLTQMANEKLEIVNV